MTIGVLNTLQDFTEQQPLRASLNGQNTMPKAATETVAAQAASVAQPLAERSLLSDNFTHSDPGTSRYVAGMLSGMEIRQQMGLTSSSEVIANAMPASVTDAAYWYGDSRMRQAKQLKDTVESNEQNLANSRDELEQKAAEALENAGAANDTPESVSAGTSGGQTTAPTAPAPAPVEVSDMVQISSPASAAVSAPVSTGSHDSSNTPQPSLHVVV